MQGIIAQQLASEHNLSAGAPTAVDMFDLVPSFRRREGRDDAGLFALFSEEQFLRAASGRRPFATSEELRLWLDNLSAAQRFEIVADAAGEVLGFAGLYVFGDGFEHAGWLMLGVREHAQRNGIGSGLLRIIVKTAHIFAGLRRLQLTVFCDNDVAIRLYKRFGFEIEGRHRCYAQRGADFVDAFTMARIFDEDIAQIDADMLRKLQVSLA